MVKNHNFCPNSESIYVILNLALVPGKVFNSRGRDVFFSLIPVLGEELQAKKVLGYIWDFMYTL